MDLQLYMVIAKSASLCSKTNFTSSEATDCMTYSSLYIQIMFVRPASEFVSLTQQYGFDQNEVVNLTDR